ncbi:MAG: InlB B-repeat-containing protein [Christensenellaceae bacterium]|jgi:uncharacterized repeat protein (TIGR02543 family)|nr:InlB B-repeat-containing protein [Christensenellaceae bacterium]
MKSTNTLKNVSCFDGLPKPKWFFLTFVFTSILFFLIVSLMFFNSQNGLTGALAEESNTIYDGDNNPITLPSQSIKPNKNQYILKVTFEVNSTLDDWTQSQIFEYSDNGGLFFTKITTIQTTISSFYSFDTTFRDILQSETFNSVKYPLYTTDGRIPTIVFNGSIRSTTSGIHVQFVEGKKYYLTGQIGFVGNYHESVFGISFYNSSLTVPNSASVEGSLLNSATQIGVQKYTLYSDLTAGFGNEFGSSAGVGVASQDLYRASPLFNIRGGVDFKIYGGIVGNGNVSQSTIKYPTINISEYPKIDSSGVSESLRSIIVIEDSAQVYNITDKETISILGVGDVIVLKGGIVERTGPGSVVSSIGQSIYKDVNFYLMGGTLKNEGGTAISLGTEDNLGTNVEGGYVIITSGYLESGTMGASEPIVKVGSEVKFIMTGGTLENKSNLGRGLVNSDARTLDILGGQIITNSSQASVQNEGSGTIKIGAGAFITNNGLGYTIFNNQSGVFEINTDAIINGEINDLPSSGSFFLVNIVSDTPHASLLIEDYTDYVNYTDINILKTKLIPSNQDYTLHFDIDNKKIYALIKIKAKIFTTEPSLETGEYFTWEEFVVPLSSKYPAIHKDQLNNYLYKGFTAHYTAIDPKSQLQSLNINIDTDSIKYTIPHVVDCYLTLSEQTVTTRKLTINLSSIATLPNIDENVSITYKNNWAIVYAGQFDSSLKSNVDDLANPLNINYEFVWYKINNGVMSEVPMQNIKMFIIENFVERHQSYSLILGNVTDSGEYVLQSKTSLRRYGEDFESITLNYVYAEILPVSIDSADIKYKHSDDPSSNYINTSLTDRIANFTPFTLSFLIKTNDYTLKELSYSHSSLPIIRPADYTVTHERNIYSGIAKAIVRFSDNFVMPDGSSLKEVTFQIVNDPIESLEVIYLDNESKNNFKRVYNAYEYLSLDGIKLIAHYKDGSPREIDPKNYEIFYLRYTPDQNSVDYLSKDGFFAINESNATVKFVYLDESIIFPSIETDLPLVVKKLETGVYMHIPEEEALQNVPLITFAHNPNYIPGNWHFEHEIIRMSTMYHWSFIPNDEVNYVSTLNASIYIKVYDAFDPYYIKAEFKNDTYYKFSAYDIFSINSVSVMLYFQDEYYEPYDVTSASRILYYHGKSKSAQVVQNTFQAMNENQLNLAEDSCFLANDNFIVFMFIPYNIRELDYMTPLFFALMLQEPVSKAVPNTQLTIPDRIYTINRLNTLINPNLLVYWNVEWIQGVDSLEYPLPGTNYYFYSFLPKDSANFDTAQAEIWLTGLPLTVSSIEIVNYTQIKSFMAGDILPNLDSLVSDGIIFKIHFNDGSSKTASSSDVIFEYAPIYPEDATENINFIGRHTYFVVSSTSNEDVKINFPIIITMQSYAEINIVSPTLIDGKTVYDGLNKMPKATSDSINETTSNYDGSGLVVNYYLSDASGNFSYGRGVERKTYRLLSDNELIIKNVGSYEVIFFYIGDADYYTIPQLDFVSFEIIEYDPWGEFYNHVSSPPILSSSTHPNGDGYWDRANLPKLFSPISFSSSDQTIINAEDGGNFYWSLNSRIETAFNLNLNVNSDVVEYTWHWEKQNYKSQSGVLSLTVYKNELKKLYAKFSNNSKKYKALDIINIDTDGILVYGIYDDGEKYLLPSNVFLIVYNGGYLDGTLDEINNSGYFGGTVPKDSIDYRFLRGDHEMISIIPAGVISTKGVLHFSMFVEVEQLDFDIPIFEDIDVKFSGNVHEVRANHDPRLVSKYYTYACSLDNLAPGVGAYEHQGSSINDPFRGWYLPYTPISEVGAYKILATFDILDENTKRDYKELKAMIMTFSIKLDITPNVSINQNSLNETPYYLGDKIPENILDYINENESSFMFGSTLVPGVFTLKATHFTVAGVQENLYSIDYAWLWTPSHAQIPDDEDGNTFYTKYISVEGFCSLKVIPFRVLSVIFVNYSKIKAGDSVASQIYKVFIDADDYSLSRDVNWTANVDTFELGLNEVTISYNFDPTLNLPSVNRTFVFNLNLSQIQYRYEYINVELGYNGEAYTAFSYANQVLIDYYEDFPFYEISFASPDKPDDFLYDELNDLFDTIHTCYRKEFVIRITRNYYEPLILNATFSRFIEILLSEPVPTLDEPSFKVFSPDGPGSDFLEVVPLFPNNVEFLGWTIGARPGNTGVVQVTDSSGALLFEWTDEFFVESEIIFFAWEAGKYKNIKFDPNTKNVDDAEPFYDIRIRRGKSIMLPTSAWDTASSVSNLYILGWTLIEGGTEAEFFANDWFSVDFSDGDTVLYAIWGDATYDVEFDLGGGSFDSDISFDSYIGIMSGDSKLGLPISVRRSLYSFAGWSYTDDRGVFQTVDYSGELDQLNTSGYLDFTFFDIGFENGANVIINLSAIWIENTYSITFEPNGANNGVMSDFILKASQLAVSFPNNAFKYTGHHFIGWALTEVPTSDDDIFDGYSQFFAEIESVFSLTPGIYNYSLSLYAIWGANTYSVDFFSVPQDSFGFMSPMILTYGIEKTLTLNNFTRKDYLFLGWSLGNTTQVTYLDGANVKDLAIREGQIISLYAVWETLIYTVTFNANGGNGSMQKHAFTVDDGDKLPKNSYTRAGYQFIGWSVGSRQEFVDIDDEKEHNLLTGVFPSQSVLLYAVWSALTYEFNYVKGVNNATGNMELSLLSYLDVLSQCGYHVTGYVFTGWISTFNNESHSSIFRAGHSIIEIIEYFELEYDNSNSRPQITMTATWSAVDYFVIFDLNGSGVSGAMNEQPLSYDAPENLNPNTFSRLGYVFTSWNTQANGDGVDYSYNEEVLNLSSGANARVRLYAQWTPITYFIHFNLDGGNLDGDTESFSLEVTFDEFVHLPTLQKTGFIFQNWLTGTIDGPSTDPIALNGTKINLANNQGDEIYLFANFYDPTSLSNLFGVVYNLNSGEGEANAQTGPTGSEIVLLNGDTISRLGFTFLGWHTNKDSKFADTVNYPINPGSSTTFSYTITNSLVILYAIWEQVNYTVIIYLDETYQNYVTRTVQYYAQYDFSNVQTSRTGYTFSGYTNVADSVNFSVSGVYSKTSDLAIKATWIVHVFSIVFDSNGGSGSMSPLLDVEYGSHTTLTANNGQIYRTGYTFNGWNETRNGNGTNYADSSSAIISSNNNAVITIFARWTPVSYNVIFNQNSGLGDMQSQTLIYDTESFLSQNVFEKVGYLFYGWNSLANGMGINFNDQQAVINLSAISSDYHLFAKWMPISYNIVFNANSGNGVMDTQTVIYDNESQLYENTFIKTGFSFSYWINGSEIYYDNASIFNLTATANEEIILNAVWDENSYSILFDPNGGSATMPTQGPLLYTEIVTLNSNLFYRDGYQFSGWSLNRDHIDYLDGSNIGSGLSSVDDAVVSLFAIWTPKTYEIKYFPNFGTGTTVIFNATYDLEFMIKAIEEIGMERAGYEFLSWNSSINGHGNAYYAGSLELNLTTEANFNLYAQWTPKVFKIQFVANDGSNLVTEQNAIFDSNIVLSENRFIRYSYFFTNWSDNSDGTGVSYLDEYEFKMEKDADIILYAQWSLISYEIFYDKNAMEGVTINGEQMTNSKHTYGIVRPLTVSTYTRSGYSLIGWSLDFGDNAEVHYPLQYSRSDMTITNNDEVTLYAVWRINTYTITFIGNGTITAIPTAICEYNSVITSPVIPNTTDNIPLRPGFVFNFWSENNDENIDTDTAFEFGGLMPAHDMVLYAKWTKTDIKYTIVFETDGGQYAVPSVTLSFDEEIPIIADPIKTGYDFVGWFRVDESDPYVLSKMPALSFTLTAKWSEAIYSVRFESYGGGNFPDVVGRYNLGTFDVDTLIPTRFGYEFSGWFSDSEFLNKVEGIQTIDFDVSTIFAKWDKQKIEISFDLNYDTGISDSPKIYELEIGSVFPNPVVARDGYIFSGWYLNKNLSNPNTYEEVPDKAVTLYAGWTIIPKEKGMEAWILVLIITLAIILISCIIVGIVMIKKRDKMWQHRK